jgi:murein L,D-transpeptidase YcbB/YkuD
LQKAFRFADNDVIEPTEIPSVIRMMACDSSNGAFMNDFRWPVTLLLAMALAGAGLSAAEAAEPGGPDRLISRTDAVLITLSNELDGATKKKLPASKSELKSLKEYYDSAGAKLLWVNENGLKPKPAQALQTAFSRADSFGLDPKAYTIIDRSQFAAHKGYPAEWLADAELRMSLAAVSYAGDAQAGRVVPSSIDQEFVDLKPSRPEAGAVLSGLALAERDIAGNLESYHPRHEQFKALKAKLAEARGAVGAGAKPVRLPDGPSLGPNTYHPQVAILRERFNVPPSDTAPRGNAAEYYDDALASAVRAFQQSKGLKPDGIVGRGTRDAMNEGAVSVGINTIIANMERWRWEPRDLGERYIMVNIPEFMYRLVNRGKVVSEDRIVSGSPKNPTPIFSDEMETVVFNPYWYVPQSILTKEILPVIQNSPDYLLRNNLEVVWLGRRTVDPYMVDWQQVNPTKVTLRQTPGPGNALGQVKFLFPNKHSVYMHDTPTKQLFDKPVRAYSHGCMRVRNPLALAKILLSDQGWNEDRIERTLASGTDDHVKLAKRLPVHITYFTAWVDDSGELKGFRDVYGYDASVRVALKLDPKNILASKTDDFEIGEGGLRN